MGHSCSAYRRKLGWFAAVTAVAAFGLSTPSQARDLTVVSWGGSYQDEQEKVYFDPFILRVFGDPNSGLTRSRFAILLRA